MIPLFKIKILALRRTYNTKKHLRVNYRMSVTRGYDTLPRDPPRPGRALL